MRKLVVIGLTAIALVAAGCGSDESREDADDVPDGAIEKTQPSVIAFNNEYPNVQSKCDFQITRQEGQTTDEGGGAGHRIYVTSSDTIIVIPDPTCPGWTPETAAGFTWTGRP